MRYTARLAVIMLASLLAAGSYAHAAEEVFFKNTTPGGLYPTAHFDINAYEMADDAPFTGAHLLSSFRFGYTASEPMRAIFRFYGVDPATGNPGQFIKQIIREFPAANKAISTVLLNSNERFTFTAEPNLKTYSNVTGGWYSIQFEPVLSSTHPEDTALRLAYGDSISYMYNLTLGLRTGPYDPGGVLASDLFFEMTSINDAIPPGEVFDLFLEPSTVAAGSTATAVIRLSSPAPAGGTVVRLSSDQKQAYFSDTEIVIPEAADSIRTTVLTSAKGVSPRGKVITLTAETDNNSVSAQLTVIK